MSSTWINRVRHVGDGEAVNGAIDSRPTRALEGNAQYLKDRIDSAELGESVCAYGETIADDVAVGMAVYRNNTTARYERALAAVETNAATGTLTPSASSDTVGIVVFKHNGTKADILLSGKRAVDISAAVAGAPLGAVPPGRYYLSSATPGMLVQQRPPVSVSVLVYTDDGYAIVQPTQRDFLEDHVHYRIRLYSQPAGKNSLGSGRHTVNTPDPNLIGWLPAGHPSFNGRAPAGAVFGYNLAKHPELARIFPPIPPSSAVVFLDKGVNRLGAALVPMGLGGLCVVDNFGIWWMSNCQGDVPWPETWIASVPPPPAGKPDPPWLTSNPVPPECPRQEEFRVVLAYTAMVFATDRTTVTSLTPAEGSPLVFTNCDGDDATTGDLTADLDLSFLVAPGEIDGSLVFKELDGDTFHQGRVAEGLVAGTGCTLSGQYQRDVPNVGRLHQGVVAVSIDTAPGERELPADLIRLAQTQERFHFEIPYIGFDPGRDTSLRMRFYVPPAGLPTNPTVSLRVQLLGRTAGTLPQLAASYRILPRPVNAATPPVPIAKPLPPTSSEQSLTMVTTKAVGADQYTEVQSVAITVAAGDTILVTLVRASNDGYTGEVGVMRPVGILTGTAL